MAFWSTGSKTNAGGIYSAIRKHLKDVNLVPAKRIIVKFDPFGSNCSNVRQFLHIIHNRKVLRTNPYCRIIGEVVCDRSEPTVNVFLTNGNTVTLKCNHLNVLEMIKIYNEHVSPLAPKEEIVTEEVVKIKRR